MSYRRVARSFRKNLAREYLEERPRARIGAAAGLMVAVLGVFVGMLYPSSHSATTINTTREASACQSSRPATSSTTSTAAAGTAATTGTATAGLTPSTTATAASASPCPSA